MKFQLQTSIKTNSQSLLFAVTHWILHFSLLQQRRKPLFMRLNYSSLPAACEAHPGNVGRIVGYEVPLWKRGNNRDQCMDLLGYDCMYKPWIIELKTGNSTDRLND